MVNRFIGCNIHNYGGLAVKIVGLSGNNFQDCSLVGGLEVTDSHRNEFHSTDISAFTRNSMTYDLGLNKLCGCGSGKKYKRCHGGKRKMATGIKSTNSSSTFKCTKINTDGTAIDLDRDSSSFEETTINAFESTDLAALAIEWGIPDYVPISEVEEAVSQVKQAKNPGVLQSSALKSRLEKHGFNMASWASMALTIATYALS